MARLRRDLPIGPGGVAQELGLIAPASGSARPTGAPRRPRAPARGRPTAHEPETTPTPTPTPDGLEASDPEQALRQRLAIRPLPGRRGRRTGRIRWYHRVRRDGLERLCWAFSVPRAVHEAWQGGEPLSSRGAVLPDGRPVVPKGADPSDHPIRCGTCGTVAVELLQLAFLEE